MLFVWRSLFNITVAFATFCSMLLLFMLFFAWCSLFDVATPFVVFCLTLLHFLLLLVWCCCFSCYSLFDATIPFVVPCLTLLLFVICFTLQLLWSFVFNVVCSSTSLLCHDVVAPLFFSFCSMLLFPFFLFWIDFPFGFFRCERSYPTSSFLG